MFAFEDLDETTRALMLEELNLDEVSGNVYVDPRLKPGAAEAYHQLLEAALESGTPESFSEAIRSHQLLKETESRHTARGDMQAKVPETAHNTLGEGEFNRYYMRAICLRAMEEGLNKVEVYRAKPVVRQRPQNPAGKYKDARELLEHLRQTNISVEGSFPGPNSGRSVRSVKKAPQI